MNGIAAKRHKRGEPLRLTLYVAGGSAASAAACANLEAILAELRIDLRPTIVDVFASPEEAMQQRIFVTPALLVESAKGREMVVGDLCLRAPVLDLLRSLQGLPADRLSPG